MPACARTPDQARLRMLRKGALHLPIKPIAFTEDHA